MRWLKPNADGLLSPLAPILTKTSKTAEQAVVIGFEVVLGLGGHCPAMAETQAGRLVEAVLEDYHHFSLNGCARHGAWVSALVDPGTQAWRLAEGVLEGYHHFSLKA